MGENILAMGLKLLGGVLATIVTGFVAVLLKRVELKYRIDIKQEIENKAQNITRSVVLALNQSLVGGLKKKGKFDHEAAQEVLSQAKEKIAQILYEEGIWRPEDWIEMAIESDIAEDKMYKS